MPSWLTTTFPEVLGKGITHQRNKRNLNQADIAKGLGITQSGYSRIEQGKTQISVLQLRRIAETLGTEAADILTEVESVITWLRSKGIIVKNERRTTPQIQLAGDALLGAFATKAPSD